MSENKTSYYEVLTAGNYESTYRIRGEVISTADYSSEFLEWHANRGGLKRLPATDTQVLEDRIAELEAQVASFKGVVDELGALKQEFRDFVSQFIFEDAPEGTPEPAPSEPTPEPEAPAAPAPQATPDEPTPEPESLPEDFPALDLLRTAGFTTRQQVQQADDATLLAIEGLGKATLTKIRSYPTGG